MSELEAKRWWQKRRWRGALAAWLALPIVYVLSIGPACYCRNRGWCGAEIWGPYAPLSAASGLHPALAAGYSAYQQ